MKNKKTTSNVIKEKKTINKEGKKKKKAFTLIELLAVIIILGILMIIAIPSVTTYIQNSRKSAYIDTAKEIISGARNLVNEGKLEMYDTGTTYYLPSSCISTENGQKSPYGEFDKAYVLVTFTGTGYNYYWVSRDETGTGVKDPVLASDLDEDDIVSDIPFDYIKEDKPQEGKTKIKVIDKDNCTGFEKEPTASEQILETEKNQLNQIPGTEIYIFKGGNPANYVKFNNEDWRIIGIYNGQMKIQRVATISSQYYDNTSPYSNVWADSEIKKYLNTTYYDTLNDTAKAMIDNAAEWNVGAAEYTATAFQAYTNEKATKWKGTETNDPGVGLMASYEFLYATGGNDSCLATPGFGYDAGCGIAANNWMKPGSYSWTMSGRSSDSDRALFVGSNGYVGDGIVYHANAVAPAVFLKSSVTITGGDGTQSSPFQLG